MAEKKISHEGSYWVVRAESTGAVLGKHKTKEDALRQLRAIEAAKHRVAAAMGKTNGG